MQSKNWDKIGQCFEMAFESYKNLHEGSENKLVFYKNERTYSIFWNIEERFLYITVYSSNEDETSRNFLYSVNVGDGMDGIRWNSVIKKDLHVLDEEQESKYNVVSALFKIGFENTILDSLYKPSSHEKIEWRKRFDEAFINITKDA